MFSSNRSQGGCICISCIWISICAPPTSDRTMDNVSVYLESLCIPRWLNPRPTNTTMQLILSYWYSNVHHNPAHWYFNVPMFQWYSNVLIFQCSSQSSPLILQLEWNWPPTNKMQLQPLLLLIFQCNAMQWSSQFKLFISSWIGIETDPNTKIQPTDIAASQ